MKTEDFTEYKDKGICGLKNLGNTCFMNSAIHCLTHTYEFNRFLDNIDETDMLEISKKNENGIILKEWNDLRTLMFSENCNISPGGFLTNVQKLASLRDRQIFTGFAQNDFTEFFLFLCDCFHEALQRPVEIEVYGSEKNATDKIATKCYQMLKNTYKNTYSEINQMFYSIQVSNLYEYNRNNPKTNITNNDIPLSTRPESMFILDLCIPEEQVSLTDCIEEYCKLELLDGDNMWFNEETNKKQEVLKCYRFFSLPQIFIISLKRFNNVERKTNTMITLDITKPLDMSKFVCGYTPSQYKYEVFAVCDHYGSTMGGHYTVSVKNANGKWYRINDMEKTEIDSSKVITKQMYCAFFRKIE